MSKSIVIITDIASPHMVEFAHELNKLSNVQMLCLEDAGQNRDSYWATDGTYSYIKHFSKVSFLSTSPLIKSRFYVHNLNQQLDKVKPDIIIVSGFSKMVSFQALSYSKKRRIDLYVWTERSRNKIGRTRKRGIYWRLIQFIFRNIKGVLVTAEDIIQQFNNYGFSENQIIYCPYPVHIQPLLEKQRDHTPTKKVSKIIFPNRLTEIYNPDMVLELIASLSKKYIDLHFFVNKSGEDYLTFDSKVKERNLSDKVSFINLKNWQQLHELYLDMDIMVLPARFSNGNFTILECMAAEVGIVISNKVLGVGKEITTNKNGFRIDLNIETFLKAIEYYIENTKILREHVQINKLLVKKYSPFEVAKKLLTIVEN